MEEELTLDLKEIFSMIKKKWWLILIITVISTAIAYKISDRYIPPTYRSTATVFIGKDLSNRQEVGYNSSEVAMYQKLMATYAEIAQSRDVAERASEKLKDVTPNQIRGGLSVSYTDVHQIMTLTMIGGDEVTTGEYLDAVIDAFFEKSKEIYPEGNLSIFDNPITNMIPINQNTKTTIAVGFLLGIMVSVGIVFLMAYMDNTIKKEEEVEKYLGIPVIGSIPYHVVKNK